MTKFSEALSELGNFTAKLKEKYHLTKKEVSDLCEIASNNWKEEIER